jgi:hypothetical protein
MQRLEVWGLGFRFLGSGFGVLGIVPTYRTCTCICTQRGSFTAKKTLLTHRMRCPRHRKRDVRNAQRGVPPQELPGTAVLKNTAPVASTPKTAPIPAAYDFGGLGMRKHASVRVCAFSVGGAKHVHTGSRVWVGAASLCGLARGISARNLCSHMCERTQARKHARLSPSGIGAFAL